MEFFWFIGEAQVVVSSSGWWNLSLLLLALSLGHLTESVPELPEIKINEEFVRRKHFRTARHVANCSVRGEVESMIKFQQEIGTKYYSATPLAPEQHCEAVLVTLGSHNCPLIKIFFTF